MSLDQLKTEDELTCSTLFHFLCSSPKDIKNFNQYLRHHIRHRRSWWDLDINFKPSKEIFDAFKDIDKDVLAGLDVFGHLRFPNVTRTCTNKSRKYAPREGRQHPRI